MFSVKSILCSMLLSFLLRIIHWWRTRCRWLWSDHFLWLRPFRRLISATHWSNRCCSLPWMGDFPRPMDKTVICCNSVGVAAGSAVLLETSDDGRGGHSSIRFVETGTLFELLSWTLNLVSLNSFVDLNPFTFLLLPSFLFISHAFLTRHVNVDKLALALGYSCWIQLIRTGNDSFDLSQYCFNSSTCPFVNLSVGAN